jgi:hypothetical protein
MFPRIVWIAMTGCAWPTRPLPARDAGVPEPLGCADVDGDGRGVGADCLGPDCNDSNPTIFADADCAAACGTDAHSPGCACDPAAFPEPEICYGGPPGTLAIGACRAGLRACETGAWGACNGEVVPGDEVCDEVDNDCDGEVDEGVVNECGTCAADCSLACVGRGCASFDTDSGTNVTYCGEDDATCITLVTAPGTGTWTHRFEGCDVPATDWLALAFEADLPADATLGFEARIGDLGSIDGATWTPLGVAPPDGSPLDLGPTAAASAGGDVLEIRVTFSSTSAAGPSLHRIEAQFSCDWAGDIG